MNSIMHSSSAVKPCRFYKILISVTPVHRLMIPRKFARQYEEDLKDHVLLRVPRGELWHVDLERDDGDIWLRNGWLEFAQFHSLTFGHILFFEYQGCCSFKVLIFNKGAVEIDYPLTGESSRQNCKQSESAKVSSSKRTVYAKENEPVIEASEDDKARALTSAKAFISQHPSSFMIKMFPSYVAGEKLGLNVKAGLLERYVSGERGMLIFQMGDKTWPVECTLYSTRQQIRRRLGSGWTQFARDNSLAAGDICVFEPINQSKVLKVSIFYAAAAQNVD